MNTQNHSATPLRRRALGLMLCTASFGLLLTAGCGNKADESATTPPTGASVTAPPGAPGAAAAPGSMNGSSASDAEKRKAAMEAAGGK